MKVCVQVDCNCPFSTDWPYYPKDLIGMHRIDADDPRAKIGSKWADDYTYCHGNWYSEGCDEEDCNPHGIVTKIISNCEECLEIDKCPFASTLQEENKNHSVE